jgi:porphobilinogen synthase
MAYAAKRSARSTAFTTPRLGTAVRRPASHQMDPASGSEALREVELDIAEGTDIVIVKPAITYLDVIARVRGVQFPDRGLPRQRRVRC